MRVWAGVFYSFLPGLSFIFSFYCVLKALDKWFVLQLPMRQTDVIRFLRVIFILCILFLSHEWNYITLFHYTLLNYNYIIISLHYTALCVFLDSVCESVMFEYRKKTQQKFNTVRTIIGTRILDATCSFACFLTGLAISRSRVRLSPTALMSIRPRVSRSCTHTCLCHEAV